MNIAIDVGNSFTHIALFDGLRIISRVDIETYSVPNVMTKALKRFVPLAGSIKNVGISSVVPQLNVKWEYLIRKTFNKSALIINYKSKLPLRLKVNKPSGLGADRICNSVYGYEFFKRKKNIIIIDMGTAITFDVVLSGGNMIGGIIAPGINLSAKALHSYTKKLPRIGMKDQNFPKTVVGRETKAAIKSGLMNYSLYAIWGLIRSIESETGKKFEVILSGGTAMPFKKMIKRRVYYTENSVLPGINYILNYQQPISK